MDKEINEELPDTCQCGEKYNDILGIGKCPKCFNPESPKPSQP